MLSSFEMVSSAIRSSQNFITYSNEVKNRTLMSMYRIPEEAISVIHHAPNSLKEYVDFVDTQNNEAGTDAYCKKNLISAIDKSFFGDYRRGFYNEDVKFIFYASQVRPNKNVLTLIKAYEFLLRSKFISHKLIMTGNPSVMKEIRDYVEERNLTFDVLFLTRLTVTELAACYKLADLAVNPSLSEGGCPFTFTEAVSVGTPVVMADIKVTEEVISDKQVYDGMSFDPFDWKALADKIEYALDNLDILYAQQRAFYEEHLIKRNWSNVVEEHISVLAKISEAHIKDG